MTRPTPLFGERALHLPEARAVVVGDLHVGLESDLRRAGFNLPSQTERMLQRLDKLVRDTQAKRVLVIGDLKHAIPSSTFQEEEELPDFLARIPARVELVRGNHDVALDYLDERDLLIHPATGLRVGDVGLVHGHTWPDPEVMEASTVVTCHNHPAVLLVDELGHRHKEPAWVRARFTAAARERYERVPEDARLLVIPAFNELVGGAAFNGEEGTRLLGPLFQNGLVDADGAHLHTLDGLDLGTVKELRRFGDTRKTRHGKRGRKRRTGWIE